MFNEQADTNLISQLNHFTFTSTCLEFIFCISVPFVALAHVYPLDFFRRLQLNKSELRILP